jgi:hypothetical protein
MRSASRPDARRGVRRSGILSLDHGHAGLAVLLLERELELGFEARSVQAGLGRGKDKLIGTIVAAYAIFDFDDPAEVEPAQLLGGQDAVLAAVERDQPVALGQARSIRRRLL